MIDYRIWQAVAIFLILSGFFLVLTLTLRKHVVLLRYVGFVLLSAVSLLFTLSAIRHFGSFQSNPYFVDLGKFFPIPYSDNPDTTIKIGNKSSDPDVLLTGFEGLISISYERSKGTGDSPDLIVNTNGLKQPLSVYEVVDGDKQIKQVVKPGQEQTVSLPISSSTQFRIALESKPEGKAKGVSIAFDLVVKNEPPLLAVYWPRPFRIIPLDGLPVQTNDKNEEVRLVRITDNPGPTQQTVASAVAFQPTISVDPGRQPGNVQTFLELPIKPAGSNEGPRDFIINNGLTKLGYSFGREVTIGSREGTLITVQAPFMSVQRWTLIVTFLWLLPVGFFSVSTLVSRANSIWILLPLVQMFLAVRFVLGLRVYLFPPYNSEAMETAVLAEMLIPLMLFCGLFSALIRLLPITREPKTQSTSSGHFRKFLVFLISFPPAYYWLSTLILFPIIYYYLQPPMQRADYFYNSIAAFEWASFWRPLLILIFAPPLYGTLAILAHIWLTRGYQKTGREFKDYGQELDEPITYVLENPPLVKTLYVENRLRIPTVLRRLFLGATVLFFLSVAITFWLDAEHTTLRIVMKGIILILACAGSAAILWVSKRYSVSWNRTVIVALQGLLIVMVASGLLRLLQLFGLSNPEYLLRLVPVRVSALFQLLGLILTMRVLAVFFFRDWQQLGDPLRGRELWGFFTIFIAPLLFIAIPSMVSGDLGAVLVNWPPLLGMTLVVTGSSLFIKKVENRWLRWASVMLSGVLIFGVLVVYMGTEKIPGVSSLLITQRLEENLPKHPITHRVILREGQARAEQAALMVGGEQLIAAMEQYWKTLNYAAHGGSLGYERDGQPSIVPIAEGKWDDQGKPKDGNARFALISLSDAVFSVYVLGEHGLLGGIGLLLLYILFFAVVAYTALRSFPETILRITLLVGIVLAITYPAIYVAAANVNGAIFTGQDIPLLGLRSYTDILHNGLLLALLTTGLGSAGVNDNAGGAESIGRRIARRNIILLVLVVLVPFLWASWCMRDVTVVNRLQYQASFNLNYIHDKFVELVNDGRISIKRDTTNKLDYDGWGTRSMAGDLVGEVVDKYNARSLRGDDHDEYQWFKIDTEHTTLSVNPRYYYQPSPFRSKEKWRGAITEGNEPPLDVLSGAGIRLRLKNASRGDNDDPIPKHGATYEPVNLSEPRSEYRLFRKFLVSDDVKEGAGEQRERRLFFIYTVMDAEGAVLEPISDLIYLNGVPIYDQKQGRSPAVRLDHGDIIAVAESNDERLKRPPRYLFTYQREENASFSYMAWFNGVYQRVYPQRDAFPSALLIAEAIEREAKQSDTSLPLTLNARLNGEVYKLLGEWRSSKRLPNLKNAATRRVGVTLMNPDNGDLLVLASDTGTAYNPENAQDARELRDTPNIANVNFARHIIGSAVKPFTAAATLHTYPSLTKMTIFDQRHDQRTVFGRWLSDPDGSITTRSERTQVSWDEFLPFSDNLYAVSLGLMGLTSNNGNSSPPFSDKDAEGLHVKIGDLPLQTHQPLFAIDVFSDDRDKRYNVGNLYETPLANNYRDLFDVRPDARADDYDTSVWTNAKTLGLLNDEADNKNLFAISPERTNLNLRHVAKTWELRSILLGGGVEGPPRYGRLGSEWSNVLQAQALARIVTGKEVKARLVVHNQEQFKNWLNGPGLWRLDLLRGLEGVVWLNKATAHDTLYPCVAHINKNTIGGEKGVGKGGRYFTIFSKTGTLKKDDDPDTLVDSIYMFAAGIWDDNQGRLEFPVVGVVYIEQGGGNKAQELAKDLLKILDRHYKWGDKLNQEQACP